MTATGLAVHLAGKNWFLDRMVWHYEDTTREQAAASASDGSSASERAPVAPA